MTQIGALAHFDEDQGAAVLHDQVDFTALAAEIAFQQSQPVPRQVGQRGIFAGLSGLLALGLRPPIE